MSTMDPLTALHRIAYLLERDGAETEQDAVATLQEYADLVQKLHTLPKPTIAAINGDALAGGAGLMTACDLAVASGTARIGYPEVIRGLVPAVVMYDLTRLIGDRRARQLLHHRRGRQDQRSPGRSADHRTLRGHVPKAADHQASRY